MGIAEGFFDPLQDIEIGQAGLDHDHIGAFGDIEFDLAQRLVGVRRVHLIGALVADERRARSDGVAKRAVKGRGIFGRVSHDLDVAETRGIEAFADRADAAIHHVGRRDDVAAGFGLNERLADQHGDGLVVEDDVVAQQAVMAVAGIGIERHIAKDADVRHLLLDGADRLADEVLRR